MASKNRSKWLHKSLLLVGILTVAAVSAQEGPAPPPQVAISPPRFELNIGPKPTTESIRVSNLGEEPVKVQVSVANWDLDEANRIRIIEPTEQSLDQWMLINPLSFTIPPGKSQNVRFSIRPRVEPTPGEHRAMIYLDQLLGDAPPGAGLRMRFQYGVAVYGQVGEALREGVVHGIDVRYDTGRVIGSFDISSTGNAHVRLDGRYTVWSADVFAKMHTTGEGATTTEVPRNGVATGQLPSLPVLAGYRRQLGFDIDLPLDPGAYVIAVDGALSGSPVDLTASFDVFDKREAIEDLASEDDNEDSTGAAPVNTDND